MEQRKSNMELLRVISILMIISFHCAFKSGFGFEPGFGINKLIVKIFWMFGELGVNLFVLISGYFMVNSHFKWKKVIRLLLEVQFYHWGKVFIGYKLGIYALYEWRDILFTFFPVTLENYWFISAYIILYILSPYLNILIQSMDQKTYQKLLLTVLTIYSVIPSVFGFFFNTTETMLYYNRLVWMIIIYFLGAYIQKYGSSTTRSKKSAIKMILISFAVLIASILIIDKFQNFFAMLGTTEPAFFWPPNTIPMVFLSIGVFSLFLHMKIPYNFVINKLASTTLGIYLLHDGLIFDSWCWGLVFHCSEYQDSPFLLLYILKASVIIFAVGVVVDLLRQVLEKYTINKLLDFHVFKLNYFKN